MSAKYVIGIDLGTTNSVLAYLPLDEEQAKISLLNVPQQVASATIETRTSLPSFLYFQTDEERANDVCSGEIPEISESGLILGEFARRRSAEVPDRTIAAAKSWLANRRVDRRTPILPWDAPTEQPKISPVQASQYYLEYLAATWNDAFPDAPIQEQQVVLTVPASFDESARELTREAAFAAGLSRESLLFLEEPQAAIYSWLAAVGDDWRKILTVGDVLLVCDVGGGTTDLSLVRVEEENGELFLRRLAVGNHLLIGGDNMDLALAYRASELLAEKGTKLNPWQSVALWHCCRTAKETLLQSPETSNEKTAATQISSDETTDGETENDSDETYKISILGRSRRLIGGTVSIDFPKSQALEIILDGFFPYCELADRPKRRSAIGVRELGLPFEPETGITKHIAAFLQNQKNLETSDVSESFVQPTRYLLNGGVFKATAIQRRIDAQFERWFPRRKPENLFAETDLDHSVAKGAAFYGWSKKRGGVRIRGASARAYYVGIESSGLAIPGAPRPMKALCVAPIGMEEGTSCDVPSAEFGLVVDEPALFRFFCSTTRRDDRPGVLLDQSHIDAFDDSDADLIETDLIETDPIETTLTETGDSSENDFGNREEYVPVQFQTNITELGVMEIWCKDVRSDRRWKLEFSVREQNESFE